MIRGLTLRQWLAIAVVSMFALMAFNYVEAASQRGSAPVAWSADGWPTSAAGNSTAVWSAEGWPTPPAPDSAPPPHTDGVAKYWVGGTGSWSDTNHWSLSSGGASGAAVPVNTDWVVIDSGSDVAAADFVVTVDVSTASLLSFSLNDPDCLANVTLAAGITFTVTGAVTITNDDFSCGSATVSISSGVTTAYGLVIAAGGRWWGGSGTHTIGSISSNTATSTCTMTSGTCTLNGGNGGTYFVMLVAASSTFAHGGGTVVVTGTGATNPWISLNTKSLNIVQDTSSMDFYYNSAWTIAGTLLINCGATKAMQQGGTGIALTVTGLVTITQGGLKTGGMGAETMVLKGGVTINGGTLSHANTGTIDCNGPFLLSSGTYSHTVATTSTFSSYWNQTGGTTIMTAGTTQFDGGANRTIKMTGNHAFYNVATSGAGTTVTLASEIAYNGTFTKAAGTNWYNGTYTADHSYTISAGTWWTTGASVGAGTGVSFSTRKSIPWDILSLTINANANLTIVYETNSNNITLGSGFMSGQNMAAYGGLFSVDSSNSFLGLLPTSRGGTGIATSIRCAIGGTTGFKNGKIAFEGTTLVANLDIGSDSAGNAVNDVANGLVFDSSNNYFYNSTTREFISSSGAIVLGGVFESHTFYGSNNGAAFALTTVERSKLTLIACTHSTSGTNWYQASYGTLAGTAVIGIVGGITKGGAGGANIYLNAMSTSIFRFYRRAYLKLTSDGSTPISGVAFGAYEATGGVDMPLSSGVTGADGLAKPQSPNIYNDAIWALQKTETYIRSTAGAMTWGTPTYTNTYGSYKFVFTDTASPRVYDPAIYSKSFTGGTDWGTAAAPIAITLNKTHSELGASSYVLPYNAGGAYEVNYSQGAHCYPDGQVTLDRATANVFVNLTVENAAGATVMWLMNATETYAANVPILLSVTNGAALNIDTALLGIGSYRLNLSIESPGLIDSCVYGSFAVKAYVSHINAIEVKAHDQNGFHVGNVSYGQTVWWDGSITTDVNVAGVSITVWMTGAGNSWGQIWGPVGTGNFVAGVSKTLSSCFLLHAEPRWVGAAPKGNRTVSIILSGGTPPLAANLNYTFVVYVQDGAPFYVAGRLIQNERQLDPGNNGTYSGWVQIGWTSRNVNVTLEHDIGGVYVTIASNLTATLVGNTTYQLWQIFGNASLNFTAATPWSWRLSRLRVTGGSPAVNITELFYTDWRVMAPIGVGGPWGSSHTNTSYVTPGWIQALNEGWLAASQYWPLIVAIVVLAVISRITLGLWRRKERRRLAK